MTFLGTAEAFTLARAAGESLQVAGPITNSSNNDQVIAMPMELTGSGTGAGVIDTGAKRLLISEVLTPTTGLTKKGSGELELSKTFTSATTTTVKEGTLKVAHSVADGIEGAGSLVVSDGSVTAQVFADHVRQNSLTINDLGKVTITGGGGANGTSVIGTLTIALPGGGAGNLGGGVTTAVPEPGTFVLLAIAGVLGLLAWRRK